MAPPPAPPPDLRLPSLDALRAFEATARLGSFERAADELHITASAVGKRIGALEELLAVALFQRGAKALVLSAVGKEYLGAIRPSLTQLAAVPLHRRPSQQRQRLRLSAPPTFARLVLVPALPALAEDHPDLELEVVLSTPDLEAPTPAADLVVSHGPASDRPDAVLMHDRLLPLACPALLAEQAPLRRPADLLRLRLLRTPVEPWAPWFQAVGLADVPEPDQGPRLVDLGLTLEAALCGQGVVLARPSLARQALQAGLLLPALGPGSTPLAPAPTAYRLWSHADEPGVAAAAAWLRQACQRSADLGLALVSGLT